MLGLHAKTYQPTDGTRLGVGPVGASWREAIGISAVLFGRGYGVYRWLAK